MDAKTDMKGKIFINHSNKYALINISVFKRSCFSGELIGSARKVARLQPSPWVKERTVF